MTLPEILQRISDSGSITVNLLLTRKCQYQCGHCMFSSSPTMPGDQMRWDDLNAIKSFIDQINEKADEYDTDLHWSINLVGGEPTLDKDHFARTIDQVSRWGHQVEMTTNGWWLEDPQNIVKFSRAVWAHLDSEMLIRISNSEYHLPWRSPELQQFFEPLVGRKPSYSARPVNPLVGLLEDKIDQMWSEAEDKEYCVKTESDTYYIDVLKVNAENDLIYIDNQRMGTRNVSPVGRAKKNQFGDQDGLCHSTDDVKFTFMPTKEGARPGRLYDPCCNGGKVPLGFADEGLRLLIKRYLYMEALHSTFPGKDLHGARCWACPSFGAKWMKQLDEKEIENIINDEKEFA